jgi:hypothetical protein
MAVRRLFFGSAEGPALVLAITLVGCNFTGLGNNYVPCLPVNCDGNFAQLVGPIDRFARDPLHVQVVFCADQHCRSQENSVNAHGSDYLHDVGIDGGCGGAGLGQPCTSESKWWLRAFYGLPPDAGMPPRRYRITVADLDTTETIFDRTFEAKYVKVQPTGCTDNPYHIICTHFEAKW